MAAFDTDYLIIGSGFGGSVSALRLAQKGYRVLVVEQGRRFAPRDMPESTRNLRRFLWLPSLFCRGFFSLRLFRHMLVLHGNAVGGGSVVYANTLLVPPEKVWRSGTWALLRDWAARNARALPHGGKNARRNHQSAAGRCRLYAEKIGR